MRAFALLPLLLCGCAIAPHGSSTTRKEYHFEGRPDGLREVIITTDKSAGRGMVILMDPKAQSTTLTHENSSLGVKGSISINGGSLVVDPQTSAIIEGIATTAAKAAVEALKTGVGIP